MTKILFAVPVPAGFGLDAELPLSIIGPFELPLQDHLPVEDAAGVRVLVTFGTLNTGAALMDRLPDLGLICCFGTGYEGVELAQAAQRGIKVTHSPGVNAGSVADLAMALLLAVNRRIVPADRFIRDGLWRKHAASRLHMVRGLEGRKIGIYGFGAIGAKIAARAAAFEAEIAYHSRSRKAGVDYTYHATLQGLADWADILMVAVRADETTRGAVDEAVLRALGPDGIIVNIARGSAVDETALIRLLQSGEVGGAGLDVFENEPTVPDALKEMPQVVLTPHLGGATLQALAAMQDLVVANIVAFLTDGSVVTPVPEMMS